MIDWMKDGIRCAIFFLPHRSAVYLHATTLSVPSKGRKQQGRYLPCNIILMHYKNKGERGSWPFLDDNMRWQKK